MNYFPGYGEVNVNVYIGINKLCNNCIQVLCGGPHWKCIVRRGASTSYAIIVSMMFSLLAWYIILKGVST